MNLSLYAASAAHRLRCAVFAAAVSTLAGCLMDANLDPNGGGTMTVKYRLTTAAQLESAKTRLRSPKVELVSAQVDADKWATFQIKFDDVTKLSTTDFFSRVTFRVNDENGVRTLNAQYLNPGASELPDEMVAYLGPEVSVAIHFPGPVVDSNATSVDGNTATWKYQMKPFTGMHQIDVHASYKSSAGKGAANDAAPRQIAGWTPRTETAADRAETMGEG
jgi:hypothetical protein